MCPKRAAGLNAPSELFGEPESSSENTTAGGTDSLLPAQTGWNTDLECSVYTLHGHRAPASSIDVILDGFLPRAILSPNFCCQKNN